MMAVHTGDCRSILDPGKSARASSAPRGGRTLFAGQSLETRGGIWHPCYQPSLEHIELDCFSIFPWNSAAWWHNYHAFVDGHSDLISSRKECFDHPIYAPHNKGGYSFDCQA